MPTPEILLPTLLNVPFCFASGNIEGLGGIQIHCFSWGQSLVLNISQPSQNGPAAGPMSRLLWEFDRLLAIRKCIILLTTRRKEKRKKWRELLSPKGKFLLLFKRVKSACFACIFTFVILNTNLLIFLRSSIKKAELNIQCFNKTSSQPDFKSDKAGCLENLNSE